MQSLSSESRIVHTDKIGQAIEKETFLKNFGEYISSEPYINTKSEETVEHHAIIIANSDYHVNALRPFCDNNREAIMDYLKGGPFENNIIDLHNKSKA